MASRLFAAASSPPLSLARRITRRGLSGTEGTRRGLPGTEGCRSYLEKVNLWEDPMSPMRWKTSHFVLATFTAWGVLACGWFKFFDKDEENKKNEVSAPRFKTTK